MAMKTIAIVTEPNMEVHTAMTMTMLMDMGTCIPTMAHPSKKQQDPADRFYKVYFYTFWQIHLGVLV